MMLPLKTNVETFPRLPGCRPCHQRFVVSVLVWNQLQEAVLLWIHQSQGLLFFDVIFGGKDGEKLENHYTCDDIII